MTVEGPDRGYSWVIVFCCAYFHFALFGLFRSWGVIYVAVIEEYGVTREEASWPVSLCSAVFQLIGPAVSILIHFVSKRAACLLGSAIATVGIVGCYFANSITWIIVFYGVIHGLGFGVVVTLIPVILNQYFVKHKASAMGIAFSGGSISSLVVPIVMEWLLDNFGLRGSFLLLGGLVMNTLVASALLRRPPWLKKEKMASVSLLENSDAKDSGLSTGDVVAEIKNRTTTASDYHVDDDFQDSVITDSGRYDDSNELGILEHSSLEDDKQNTGASNNDSILFGGSITKIEDSANYDECHKDDQNDCRVLEPLINGQNRCKNADPPINEQNDGKVVEPVINEQNDCKVVEPLINRQNGCKVVEHVINGHSDCKVNEPLINEQQTDSAKANKHKLESKKSKFKCTAHLSIADILKNYYFYLLTFSMLVFFVGLQSFFVVLVDYAKDKGIDENQAVYLMSVFSLTDIFGRSCLGWVTDRQYVKRKNMVIFNFVVISILQELYPLFNHLTELLIIVALYGISAGSCITLFFVLQAEYFGVKKLTLVVGLTSFINGALTLLRPAMIGVFRDTIGSYDWMFHSLGLASLLFAFIWMTESWLTRHKTRANNAIQNDQDV